ncbi:methyltransferase domain-containing protein [uncultured Pseudoteredinibacter sp.]|uniref:class I SAM-dependent methyltransferase n=1 Tax=uncultured Pseudoteredinibacter sp. TaxID=1641701 RepID=UPI002621D948|nr:methyltransferase domain-containing protein [uncultured Pseudoteredinibacter sp.]
MFKFTIIVLLVIGHASVHSYASSADYTVIDTTVYESVHAAVNDSTRLATAKARDSHRKPLDILLFSTVKPNDKILEITPGEGYYTALLSRVVGDKGTVYSVDPARAFQHLPRIKHFFSDYQKLDFRENVQYSVQQLDHIQLPEKVDQIWMVLYYHDTYWTGEDRQEMNRRLFKLLKPGGSLLVIDHHAHPKDRDQVTRSLHRIHDSLVMTELVQAGFVLHSTSDILSNPDDPRTDSVFAPQIRGRSDRFVWRLRKSSSESGTAFKSLY